MTPSAKRISLILIGVIAAHGFYNFLLFWQRKWWMNNAPIPENIKAEHTAEYLSFAGFEFFAAIIGAILFFREKYAMALILCITALIIEPFIPGSL